MSMDIRKGTRGAAKQDGSRGWDWRGGGKIDFDFGFDFGMDPGGDANTWICARMAREQWNSGRALPPRGVYPTPSHIGAAGPPETTCQQGQVAGRSTEAKQAVVAGHGRYAR